MSVFVDHSVLKHRHSRLKDVGPDDHHREWGWTDEQAGKHEVHIPYAYTKSWVEDQKVLGLGSSGSWDGGVVTHPCCLYLPTVKPNYPFQLYYSGHDGSWDNARIGRAYSADGISFTRDANNPVVTPFDSYGRPQYPSVIYDIYESDSNKRWKMVCMARLGTTNKLVVLYSSNGESWAFWKEPTQPTNFKNHPSCFRIGNEFFVLYTNLGNELSLCIYNRDFSSVYDVGTIVSKGSAGLWDENKISEASLYWSLGVWYVLYTGADSNNYFKIGMALSSFGFSWTKYALNPVFDGAELGDYTGVIKPSLVCVEKDFRAYVAQRKTAGGDLEIYKFDIV